MPPNSNKHNCLHEFYKNKFQSAWCRDRLGVWTKGAQCFTKRVSCLERNPDWAAELAFQGLFWGCKKTIIECKLWRVTHLIFTFIVNCYTCCFLILFCFQIRPTYYNSMNIFCGYLRHILICAIRAMPLEYNAPLYAIGFWCEVQGNKRIFFLLLLCQVDESVDL